ncbi:MAG: O-methyltransferase [Sphingobacteriales bacterium]|nr:MAG: O-methyltransferase [Sphingobacteriales bacterium]
MEIIHQLANEYAEKFTSPEDEILQLISNQTQESRSQHAHMLSGHVQGKFLELISKIIRPQRILEIGTFTGYSAICLAKGLAEDGVLHTVELRQEDADISRAYFIKSGLDDKIISHAGNALDIIPALKEEWDLVFLDADKPGYISYFNLVLPKLKKGGIILADNVLFHGEVLQEELKGKNAIAIHAFNEHVKNCEEVEIVLLTVRDGLMLIRKK